MPPVAGGGGYVNSLTHHTSTNQLQVSYLFLLLRTRFYFEIFTSYLFLLTVIPQLFLAYECSVKMSVTSAQILVPIQQTETGASYNALIQCNTEH